MTQAGARHRDSMQTETRRRGLSLVTGRNARYPRVP
jgi:hypothetical protein